MILHLNIMIEDGDFWQNIEIVPDLECETFLYDVLNLTELRCR